MSELETPAGPSEMPHSGRLICTCIQDPLEALPPELRPKNAALSGLMETTCPACGLHYLTNRTTDVCIRCEAKRASRGETPSSPDRSPDV
jgi:hypothetical protein